MGLDEQDGVPQHVLDRFPLGWPAVIETGFGWLELVVALDAEIAGTFPDYEIYQCKSKYGELRFHVGPDEVALSPGVFRAIQRYEDMSRHTCEVCGRTGDAVAIGGWVSTLCREHADDVVRNVS